MPSHHSENGSRSGDADTERRALEASLASLRSAVDDYAAQHRAPFGRRRRAARARHDSQAAGDVADRRAPFLTAAARPKLLARVLRRLWAIGQALRQRQP
jgi:hypothetical protein